MSGVIRKYWYVPLCLGAFWGILTALLGTPAADEKRIDDRVPGGRAVMEQMKIVMEDCAARSASSLVAAEQCAAPQLRMLWIKMAGPHVDLVDRMLAEKLAVAKRFDAGEITPGERPSPISRGRCAVYERSAAKGPEGHAGEPLTPCHVGAGTSNRRGGAVI